MITISYGTLDNSIDVTKICVIQLLSYNIITIPAGDINRATYFGDPIFGVLKKIYINSNGNLTEHDDMYIIRINITNGLVNRIWPDSGFAISYGTPDNFIDITGICLDKLLTGNIINIPYCDVYRAIYFGDPIYGVLKKVYIISNGILTEHDDMYAIRIDISNGTIITINEDYLNNKLNDLQSKLSIQHGSFIEELPEQKMAVRYLTGYEKVLEIGGNIGRNTLIIGSILLNNNNFVTLECDPNIANILKENRDLNKLNFHIEPSALSKRNLIQQGWQTIVSGTVLDGYTKVDTINFQELKNKYNINFDTLVLDCEGAFYYILIDMPEILDNVKLIIMENDYFEISNKECVDEILTKNNFYREYSEGGGWGPCSDSFFEVWKKY